MQTDNIINSYRKVVGFAIFLAFVFGLSLMKSAHALSPITDNSLYKQIIPPEYFGMHIHHFATTTHWPRVSFGSWRLLDANVNWFNLEPKKGHWNFAYLDKYAWSAQGRKVKLLLPLAFPPAWASSRPREKGPYGPGTRAEPKRINDWVNYIKKVATRYKGRINEYELWNEANLKGYYSGNQDKLIELAKYAYKILNEVDPKNILVSPSVVGQGTELQWLDSYLEKGGGQYADVIGFHFYVPKKEPEAMLPLIRKVRRIMMKYHVDNKPLWNTESGWWVENSDDTPKNNDAIDPSWIKLQPYQAAAFVARALIIARFGGLDRFYWYAWDNTNMGLIEPTMKTLKPSAIAYNTVFQWMVGARLASCKIQPNLTWVCTLQYKNNRLGIIIWNPHNNAFFKVPHHNYLDSYEDILGHNHAIDNKDYKISVTYSPILIKARALP